MWVAVGTWPSRGRPRAGCGGGSWKRRFEKMKRKSASHDWRDAPPGWASKRTIQGSARRQRNVRGSVVRPDFRRALLAGACVPPRSRSLGHRMAHVLASGRHGTTPGSSSIRAPWWRSWWVSLAGSRRPVPCGSGDDGECVSRCARGSRKGRSSSSSPCAGSVFARPPGSWTSRRTLCPRFVVADAGSRLRSLHGACRHHRPEEPRN